MNNLSMNRSEHTVLLVADDFRVLILAQAVLAGKGHRVLVAHEKQFAIFLLKQNHLPLDSVAIQADMDGCDELQGWALKRGARHWTFRCKVNDQSVLLEGLESGA